MISQLFLRAATNAAVAVFFLFTIFLTSCGPVTTTGASFRPSTAAAPYTSVIAGEDGRFTIGTGSKRLMYGYPVPYSTSHFVLAVDGAYASNSPRFYPAATYLTGELRTAGADASPRIEISFAYNGIEITQRLVPVDGRFADVNVGEWGQYYRIEYEITNVSDSPKRVGLLLLIDTMIDDNDAAQMDADGTRVSTQTPFAGATVPSTILVYRVAGNMNELTASLVTDKGRAVKPDFLYVGRWSYLHGVLWDVNLENGSYTDSGILLKWNEQSIAPQAARYLATHYGLPKPGRLSVLTSAEGFRRDSTTIYFDLGKSDLTAQSKSLIDALVSGRAINGAFVEVYADAKGNEATNLALSKKRAQSVTAYLRQINVPEAVIIPKSYGETRSDQSEEAQSQGRQEDRKAVIVIFTR